ncbi:M15 family metallopeptidase [Microlunatus elymi]|uniref:M15 family metallopeptidase n=1 Tax=Microlunatus elymi TaxID=2596828 RepID=UPI00143CEB38|nr:M15 family metallopeptidase [Microlunatus elymi]
MSAVDTPIKGRFFQDIGSYGFSGTVSGATTGQKVEVWWAKSTGGWQRLISTTAKSSGSWSVNKITRGPGIRRFRATLGGNPSSSGVVHSGEVKINIENAYPKVNQPPSSVDSLSSPTISGTVFPARAGVLMHFRVKSGKDFHDKATMRTDSKGRFGFTFSTGKGDLRSYYLRAVYWDARGKFWEGGNVVKVTRSRVLNAKVTKTTAADVAKTYRAGCPVGPSKLRTIKMNYEGFDHKMHRGVMIVRSDRVDSVIASFNKSLGKSIRRMDNPNLWGGNDPKQMEADNTSAFNCRKVTGNPYAQSPHSYGIAIDINTRENPYRDVNGKWWPKSGKAYIKRTPFRQGMLTKSSGLTKQLRSRGYFWGGLWNPGRDYQHFEYDK